MSRCSHSSLPLSFSRRFTRVNKPGQHMFHELYCSGPNTHAAAARLLPLRQTQVRDAIKLLSGVWDVAALSGGTTHNFHAWTCYVSLFKSPKERNACELETKKWAIFAIFFFNNHIIQNVLSHRNLLQKAESLLCSFVESKERGREEGKYPAWKECTEPRTNEWAECSNLTFIEPDQPVGIILHSLFYNPSLPPLWYVSLAFYI